MAGNRPPVNPPLHLGIAAGGESMPLSESGS